MRQYPETACCREVLREVYDREDSASNVFLTNEYELGTRRLARSSTTRETATSYGVADRAYSYDPTGNITRIADTPSGGLKDYQCFAYDHLRRLSEAWTPTTGDCAAVRSVGALGGAAPYWSSWTFDRTGNRVTETSHASAGDTTRTSVYPVAGGVRPHAVGSVTSTGPNGTVLDSFTYDEVGAVSMGQRIT